MGAMKMPIIADGPDFVVHGIPKYHIFGQEVWIITTTIRTWFITLALLLIGFVASRKLKNTADVPGIFQNMLEYAVGMFGRMVEGILDGSARRFVNHIGTVFLFILFCNSSGLFGLRAPTGDFGVTFLLDMFISFIVNYQGIKNWGVEHFTGLFQPTPMLFPINVIGEVANSTSISLRLFASLLSGIITMGLWYGTMPWLVKIGTPAALHAYCDLFSGHIRTYIFCMLIMVYINDKME